MNKLYVSDLDFTLLHSQKHLSQFAKDTINTFGENNIKFTIATAQGMGTLQHLLWGINLPLPIIEFNGAVITDFKTKKPEYINSMSQELVQQNKLNTKDQRTIGLGAQILSDLGVQKMRVLSAPKRFHAISGYGLEIVEYVT